MGLRLPLEWGGAAFGGCGVDEASGVYDDACWLLHLRKSIAFRSFAAVTLHPTYFTLVLSSIQLPRIAAFLGCASPRRSCP